MYVFIGCWFIVIAKATAAKKKAATTKKKRRKKKLTFKDSISDSSASDTEM